MCPDRPLKCTGVWRTDFYTWHETDQSSYGKGIRLSVCHIP